MHGKVCVVTGASAGIGKEVAVGLARRGAQVVLLCRDRGRGEAALAEVRRKATGAAPALVLADLSAQRQVRRAAAEILAGWTSLHVLVNNAGVVNRQRRATEDGLEDTFAVNHLAPFLLTHLLLERLRASAPARIVVVASQVERRASIDFDDLQAERAYDPLRAYFQSKLANVLYTYELARRLDGSGVVVNCVHPGVIATNLLCDYEGRPRALGLLQRLTNPGPDKGARMILRLASEPDFATVSGRYYHETRDTQSSAASRDRALQQRLWEVSEALTAPR